MSFDCFLHAVDGSKVFHPNTAIVAFWGSEFGPDRIIKLLTFESGQEV
jgi:hypothetical protein